MARRIAQFAICITLIGSIFLLGGVVKASAQVSRSNLQIVTASPFPGDIGTNAADVAVDAGIATLAAMVVTLGLRLLYRRAQLMSLEATSNEDMRRREYERLEHLQRDIEAFEASARQLRFTLACGDPDQTARDVYQRLLALKARLNVASTVRPEDAEGLTRAVDLLLEGLNPSRRDLVQAADEDASDALDTLAKVNLSVLRSITGNSSPQSRVEHVNRGAA